MEKQPRPSSDNFERPAEFEFHQKRFEKGAEEENDRVINRILGREMTAEDFAHEEALRDLDDYYKRLHPEFKESNERLQIVVKNLKEKAKHPENEDVHAALLVLGAGMKAPYGAGAALGLNEIGIGANTFDALYGISAGSPTVLYYAAGPEQTSAGATMLCEDLASTSFINKAKILNRPPEIVNLRKLKDEMEEGEYKLDQEAVKRAQPDVYLLVTRPVGSERKDPHAEFLNAKEIPNMADGVRASMSIPGLTGENPMVNGIRYYDGGFDPLPIEAVINQYEQKHGTVPTDVLIFAQTPFTEMDSLQLSTIQRIGVNTVKRFASLGQLEKALIIQEQLRKSLIYIQDVKERRGVNVGIVWSPDMGLSTLNIDQDNMKAAVLESARGLIRDFGEPQPQKLGWQHERSEEIEPERQKEAA